MRTAKSNRRANGGTDPTPRRRTTRILAGLAAGSLIAAVAPTASAPTDGPTYAASTTVPVDREGTYLPVQSIEGKGTTDPEAIPPVTSLAFRETAVRPSIAGCGRDHPCYRYVLELPEQRRRGERLRFGIDFRQAYLNYKSQIPRYDVVILDAEGEEVVARARWSWETREVQGTVPAAMPWGDAPPISLAVSHGHLEAFVDDPRDARYIAVVIAQAVEAGTTFQARVKLEPPYRPNNRRLLPDLQPEVPYELTLGDLDRCTDGGAVGPGGEGCGPNPGNVGSCGGVLDDPTQNPTLPCHLRLRFSYGYRNAGDGPLRLEFEPLADGATEGRAVQRVFRAPAHRDEYDLERSETRDAGEYHLHASHQHYHYDPMFSVELHAYDPASGTRSPAPISRTPKVGNCGHDWFMADFAARFDQDPRGVQDSDGCVGLLGSRVDRVTVALSAGWGDTYGYATGDSYVPFATQGADGTWQRLEDGEYLLVQRVNIDHALLEEDVTDNVGYTHLRVDGSTVCIIERGLGESPPERTAAEPLAWPTCPPA